MSPTNKQLSVGDTAPEFTLLDEQGATHSLADYRGRSNVVLIFYPKDFTPGCTAQLCAVRDDIAGFVQRQAVVLGVNPAEASEHLKFIARYSLKNPLLIDHGREVAKRYGAIGTFMGHPTTKRTVVIVDRGGIIRYYRHGLPPNSELFSILDELL